MGGRASVYPKTSSSLSKKIYLKGRTVENYFALDVWPQNTDLSAVLSLSFCPFLCGALSASAAASGRTNRRGLPVQYPETYSMFELFVGGAGRSESMSLDTAHKLLGIARTTFTDRIMLMLDVSATKRLDFRDFMLVTWNYATYTRALHGTQGTRPTHGSSTALSATDCPAQMAWLCWVIFGCGWGRVRRKR